MKELISLIGHVFCGEWKMSVSLVLQLPLQIAVACTISVGIVGGSIVMLLLMVAQLLIALLICMMPASLNRLEGHKPKWKPALAFFVVATAYAILLTGVTSGVVLGLASWFANGSFLTAYAISVLGSTAINLIVTCAAYLDETRDHNETF